MKILFFLGLLVPIAAILLPHKKHENTVSVNGSAQVHTEVEPFDDSFNDTSSSGAEKPIHSKPMIMPAIQTKPMFPAENQDLPQTFIGTVMNPPVKTGDVNPSQATIGQNNNISRNDLIHSMVMPFPPATDVTIKKIPLNDTKFLSDLFNGKPVPSILVQPPTPQVMPVILPAPKSDKGSDQKTGPKLPPFDLTQPQVSPPESIINPLIPPVPIAKSNGKGKKGASTASPQMHILPFYPNAQSPDMTPIAVKPLIFTLPDQPHGDNTFIARPALPVAISQPGPSFDTSVLQGSILLKLLTNITTACRNEFIAIGLSIRTSSSQDFQDRMTNWSVKCNKEKEVKEVFDKMDQMQSKARLDMNALVARLPLDIERFQALEMNKTIPMDKKLKLVDEFMNSLNDTRAVKALKYLNSLFVSDMISAIVPGFSKPSVQPRNVNSFQQYLEAKRLQSSVPTNVKMGTNVNGQAEMKLTKRSVELTPEELVELEEEELENEEDFD